jgi:hypothetical protein
VTDGAAVATEQGGEPGPLGRRVLVWSAAILLVFGAAGLAWFGARLSERGVLALYAALFVPYGVLAALAPRARGRAHTVLSFGGIAGLALAVRALLLPASPLLSDDVYRYVWDGRVGFAGINPYRHAPASEALSHLRDTVIWPAINHPEVPTIYPPGAQYLFELNALAGGGVVGIKAIFVLVEIACVALCGWWLSNGDAPWSRDRLALALVLYALNPLVFVEVAWSGHLDVAAWGLLTAGLVLVWQRATWTARIAAGVLIGASIAVKFLGVLLLPLVLFGRFDGDDSFEWRRRLVVVTVAPLVTMMAYLPFLGAGSDLFEGFGTYAQKWRGNDGAYRIVYRSSRHALREWGGRGRADASSEVLFRFDQYDELFHRMGWTKEWKGRTIPMTTFSAGQMAAHLAKAIAVLVVLLVLSFAVATRLDSIRASVWTLLALYVFAPIVHPWYVAWLVPLAALRPNWSTFVYSLTVLAAYIAWVSAQTGGEWWVPDGAVAVEYGLVVLATFVDVATGLGGDET